MSFDRTTHDVHTYLTSVRRRYKTNTHKNDDVNFNRVPLVRLTKRLTTLWSDENVSWEIGASKVPFAHYDKILHRGQYRRTLELVSVLLYALCSMLYTWVSRRCSVLSPQPGVRKQINWGVLKRISRAKQSAWLCKDWILRYIRHRRNLYCVGCVRDFDTQRLETSSSLGLWPISCQRQT